jgi:hypothetical protein
VAAVVEVVQLRCALCKVLFEVCVSCFRGQAYCSKPCRDSSARVIRRAANARNQQSEEGRKDHRDRQREHQARKNQAAGERVEAPPLGAPVRPASSTSLPSPVVEAGGGSLTDVASRKLDSSMNWSPRRKMIARRSLYVSKILAFVVDKALRLVCRVCGAVGTHIVRPRSRAPP